MKKINTYSAQFKIIQPVQNHPNEIENNKINPNGIPKKKSQNKTKNL